MNRRDESKDAEFTIRIDEHGCDYYSLIPNIANNAAVVFVGKGGTNTNSVAGRRTGSVTDNRVTRAGGRDINAIPNSRVKVAGATAERANSHGRVAYRGGIVIQCAETHGRAVATCSIIG